MNNMKKRLIIICSSLLILTLCIGGTLAYFFDQQEVKNEFTVNDLGIGVDLTEPNWDPDKAVDIMPGDIIPKDPTITNEKDEAYARVIVTIQDKSGNVITDADQSAKIFSMLYYASSPITSKISTTQLAAYDRVNPAFELDTARSSNGIYYFNYKKIMVTGESSMLFTGVVVPFDWTQTDIDDIGNYDILVKVESIQAKNFDTAAEAFTALDTHVNP